MCFSMLFCCCIEAIAFLETLLHAALLQFFCCPYPKCFFPLWLLELLVVSLAYASDPLILILIAFLSCIDCFFRRCHQFSRASCRFHSSSDLVIFFSLQFIETTSFKVNINIEQSFAQPGYPTTVLKNLNE